MTNIVLILVTALIGALRFVIVHRLDLPTAEGSYEALSHLFVGGLFGAWFVRRDKWLWLILAVSVSLLELVMFLIQKAGALK